MKSIGQRLLTRIETETQCCFEIVFQWGFFIHFFLFNCGFDKTWKILMYYSYQCYLTLPFSLSYNGLSLEQLPELWKHICLKTNNYFILHKNDVHACTFVDQCQKISNYHNEAYLRINLKMERFCLK